MSKKSVKKAMPKSKSPAKSSNKVSSNGVINWLLVRLR